MCSKCSLFKSEVFTCRQILSVLVTTGFIINAFLKTIFNITIVAMTKTENKQNKSDLFEWDESQKQSVLSIFFWGFAFTKIPSGRLAETFGSRNISGYSMALAGLLSLLTPIIARFNYYMLLVSRVVMGFLVGASWPAVMPLISKWIPSTEQSLFMSCITSTSIGYALTFLLGGFLISEFGWPSVFYVSGSVSMLWSMLWFYLVYDSPQQHPRISLEEKQEIESKIGKETFVDKIPWRKILSSKPVWGIIVAQMSSFFGNITLATQLASYLDQVFHCDIKDNGIFSSLPYYGVYLVSLGSGYVADRLLQSKTLSRKAVRQIFGAISMLIPGIFMIVLELYGDNFPAALTSICLASVCTAMTTAGHCANIIDISPSFSGTICGLANMLGAFAVFFSSRIVATLLQNGHTFQEWRPLFWILSGTYCCGGVIYLCLCSGKAQSWDSTEERKECEEGHPLNK